MIIYQLEKGETANYASEELAKYLKAVSGIDAIVKYEKGEEEGIILATFDKLGISMKDIENAKVDDAYDVDVKNLNGYISGSNIRSMLYGIYAYFYAAGCRYFRPGEGGDYIPKKDLTSFEFKAYKKADCRYRCDCLEGSISYEMVNERLRWLLKAGYNVYMIQGITPTAWLDRWYSHLGNPYKEGKKLTMEEEFDITAKIEKDIKKYGLLFHDVGHGYLFPAYGIYRDDQVDEMDETLKSHLALRDGERKILHGSLKYTNLCYSNPEVRKRIVDYFVGYLKEKPSIDYLQIWLADNRDNDCECEECQKGTPTDFYVMLLNEIDEAFTKNNIDAKIVFILYNSTMAAPLKERIKNPDRFVLMPAIRGSWGEYGYAAYDPNTDTDFLEKDGKPGAFSTVMRHKKEWGRAFEGDVFFFDYHLYSLHFCDLGHTLITKRLVRDVKLLEKHGSKGLMNCCTPRLNMPTALPTYACGHALFDLNLDLEATFEDYFKYAFGEDGEKTRKYLETIGELFLPDLMADTGVDAADEEFDDPNIKIKLRWMNNKEAHESFSKIKKVLEDFKPIIDKNINTEDPAQRKSWELLEIHYNLCVMLSEAYVLGSEGKMGPSQKICTELIDYLARHEDDYLLHFDFMLYLRRLRLTFGITNDLFAPVE